MNRRDFLLKGSLATAGLTLGQLNIGHTQIGKNDIVQLGIIGTGSRGQGIINIIKQLPQFKTVACCDMLPFRLEKAVSSAGEGCKAYNDYRKLLADKDIDAVVIATPLSMHYQMAVDALDSGKHVYCEKAMTYEKHQARDLIKKVASADH